MRAGLGHLLSSIWIAVALVLLLFPSPVNADASHYQTLQLGERSRGMAAAFTAFAADGAAIWFNPAGLPLLEPKLLQGSLSLIQRRTVDIEGAIITDGPDGPGGDPQVEDFELKSNPTLPGFAVASFAVGKRREDLGNRKPVQFAVSAFQTYNTEFGGDINFQDQYGRTNSLQFYQKDRRTYFGFGIGHRPNRHFSWGVTLLASNRTIEHVETGALADGGVQDESQGSPCETSPTIPFCILDARQLNRNTVFTMSSWDLTLRFGILNLFGKRWRFGVMFQPPGVHVGGKSTLRFEFSDVRSSMDPDDPDLSDSVFAKLERDSRSPIPWELRVGMSYVISAKVVIAADLQLVGPVADGSIAPGIPQLPNRADTSGLLLATSTKRDFTWNVSFGSEIQITKFLFTRFGFLTDRSAAPSASAEPGRAIRPAEIDRYGFSTSIGGHKEGKGLSAGVSLLFGKGTGNGLDFRGEAIEGQMSFIRVPVKERIFIISIGGDIGQTADVVKQQVKEKKREQELEEQREKDREVTKEMEAAAEAETDPELKAAKEQAVEARQEAEAAEDAAKEARDAAKAAEDEAKALEEKKRRERNLSEEDQGAIQGATQSGVGEIR